MSLDSTNERERLEDLLLSRVTFGLNPAEEAKLAALLPRFPDIDPREWELAAALVDQAYFPPAEPLPTALLEKLIQDAAQHLPITQPRRPEPRTWWNWTTINITLTVCWALALGAILLVTFAPKSRDKTTPLAERQAKLATDPETKRYTVAKAGDGQQGQIYWNSTKQEGYLELNQFPANNPKDARYQLWIVDGMRTNPKHAQPVDGGLFDVQPDGKVIVPIRPALPVGEAAAFAITREVPEGVVVSEGPHLMVLVAAK